MLLDGVALGFLGFLCFTIASRWSDLSESIPGAGTTSIAVLFAAPLLGIAFFLAFSYLRRIPHRFNYIVSITEENAERQYRNALLLLGVVKVETSAMFSYLGWYSVRTALGEHREAGWSSLPVMAVILLATVGLFGYRSTRLK